MQTNKFLKLYFIIHGESILVCNYLIGLTKSSAKQCAQIDLVLK